MTIRELLFFGIAGGFFVAFPAVLVRAQATSGTSTASIPLSSANGSPSANSLPNSTVRINETEVRFSRIVALFAKTAKASHRIA